MLYGALEENLKVVGFDYNSMNKKAKVHPKKNTEFKQWTTCLHIVLNMCILNKEVTRTLRGDVTIMVNMVI